jgi:hypothetical protein
MNSLGYADVSDREASMASTIASTAQQMSMSFGVAAASLTVALFIPDRFHAASTDTIAGIHRACFTLGALTILSTALFRALRPTDGDNMTHRKIAVPEAAST